MALPALFAACADEDFISQGGPSFENNGEFVSLPEGWAVGVSRGESASTKVAWDLQAWGGALRYSWLPALNEGETGIVPEHIGFAWRGDAPDSQVRTNYKFTLSGYLKKGEENPKFKECDDKLIVTNGYLFGNYASGVLQLQEYDESQSKTEMQTSSDYTLNWANNAWTLKNNNNLDMYDTQALPEGAPDVRTGIFTTENSTVFSGDYIVYFPFNEEFAETGNLPAVSPASFTQDMDNKNLAAHLNGKTFAYGTAKIEKGGTMAEGFDTQNLSSIIAFNLVNETEGERWISKVILYDEGSENGFYTKVGLDATKIGTATGKDLYVVNENTEYSPTLLVNLEGTVQGSKKDYMALTASGDGKSKIVTLAALPTTLVKPVVYIMLADGLSVKKELAVKPLNPGEVTGYTVTLTKADLEKKVAVVVDTKSFLQAWVKAWDSTEKSYTIETLGDITFDKTVDQVEGTDGKASFDLSEQPNGMLFNKDLTIEGDGKLILPADLTWLVKASGTKDAYPTLTINNPIVIENEGCCGNAPARLMLRNKKDNYGAYVLGNTIENNGEMYIGTDNGVGIYTFKGNINNNYDADLEKAGVINFGGKNLSTINVEKTIKNAGIMNTVPYLYEGDGTTAETAGNKQSVVVNLNNIDNVGEKSQLNIGKQTIVYMNGAANNEGKITIATNNGTTQELDGTLEINGALKNANEIEVFGVMRRIEGTFANTADDAKLIDHAGAQVTGGNYDITKGDYICDVDNALTTDGDRLGYALNENRGVTIVRFVDNDETDDKNVSYKYDLYKYLNGGNYSLTGKNFVVATTGKNAVTLSCTNPGDGTDKNPAAPAAATIDGYLEVNNEAELSGIMLTVKGDVKINVAEDGVNVGKLTVKKVNSASAAIEAQTALTVEGNLNVNAGNAQKNLIPTYTVAQFARTCVGSTAKAGNLNIAGSAVASFQRSTYSDIHGNVVNAGEFVLDLTSGTATGVPGEVWCNSFSKVGNGKWTNGSPSTY